MVFSCPIGFLLRFMVLFLLSSRAASLTGIMYSTAENPSSSFQDLLIQSSGRSWPVPTGHIDGRVSLASETNPLPDLTHSIDDDQIRMFFAMGLNAQELESLGRLRKLCIFEVNKVEQVDIEMPPRASPSGPHN